MKAQDEARWFDTHGPEGPWDYIVVGSGMGGMTAASLLTRLGRRVLVLEQHYVPGGFTHTFKRKRWSWDVGVHAVGEVSPKAMVGRILAALTDEQLQWDSLGGVYDEFYFPDLRIDFPDERRAFVAALEQAFPQETRALGEYFNRVRAVSGTMQRYYLSRLAPPAWAPLTDTLLAREAHKALHTTTARELASITDNERLKTVLTAQWGYYGSTPERSSFAIQALVAKHFWHGGFYPRGGSGSIARGLLRPVAQAGGFTRIRATVKELVVEHNAVRGVRLESGEFIPCAKVLSAAGALTTVRHLLAPAQRAEPWAQELAALKPSPCHVCLYLGFKGDVRAAGAGAANKWFWEVWDSEKAYWDIDDPKAKAPVLYCSFPSLKDPLHDPGPEQLHTGEVVTFVPYERFAPWRDARWRKRGEDYDALKSQLQERLLAQFFEHMPHLKPLLAFAELSTPVSTEHFTRAAAGSIYGLEPTPERFAARALRPRTPVKGLFLGGSDVATVGVIGAMMGGLLAATAAEPAGALRWLRAVLKK